MMVNNGKPSRKSLTFIVEGLLTRNGSHYESSQPAVTLTGDERKTLETFVHRGKANARTLTRARLLLKSAEG